MNNFDFAFDYLLGDEGKKYTNKKNDRGGPTKFGITKRTYEAFFKKTVEDSEIENMTEATAKQIYFEDFWKFLRLDEIESQAVATAVFDCAVLYSPKTAVLMAQRALRTAGRSISTDGRMGDETLQALNGVATLLFLTLYRGQVLVKIEAIITAIPADAENRDGWTNRANRLLTLKDQPKNGGVPA